MNIRSSKVQTNKSYNDYNSNYAMTPKVKPNIISLTTNINTQGNDRNTTQSRPKSANKSLNKSNNGSMSLFKPIANKSYSRASHYIEMSTNYADKTLGRSRSKTYISLDTLFKNQVTTENTNILTPLYSQNKDILETNEYNKPRFSGLKKNTLRKSKTFIGRGTTKESNYKNGTIQEVNDFDFKSIFDKHTKELIPRAKFSSSKVTFKRDFQKQVQIEDQLNPRPNKSSNSINRHNFESNKQIKKVITSYGEKEGLKKVKMNIDVNLNNKNDKSSESSFKKVIRCQSAKNIDINSERRISVAMSEMSVWNGIEEKSKTTNKENKDKIKIDEKQNPKIMKSTITLNKEKKTRNLSVKVQEALNKFYRKGLDKKDIEIIKKNSKPYYEYKLPCEVLFVEGKGAINKNHDIIKAYEIIEQNEELLNNLRKVKYDRTIVALQKETHNIMNGI